MNKYYTYYTFIINILIFVYYFIPLSSESLKCVCECANKKKKQAEEHDVLISWEMFMQHRLFIYLFIIIIYLFSAAECIHCACLFNSWFIYLWGPAMHCCSCILMQLMVKSAALQCFRCTLLMHFRLFLSQETNNKQLQVTFSSSHIPAKALAFNTNKTRNGTLWNGCIAEIYFMF